MARPKGAKNRIPRPESGLYISGVRAEIQPQPETLLGDILPQPKPAYPIVIDSQSREVMVKLTETEIIVRCKELIANIRSIADEGQSQKNEREQMKARLAQLEEKQKLLAGIVSSGEERQMVDIIIEAHEGDMVQEKRKDTGEVLISRPTKDSERQLMLALRDAESSLKLSDK